MDQFKSACEVSDCNCRGVKCRRIAFVRQGSNNEWYEVKKSVAREKVGNIFSDLLADNYSSSSKSKTIARKTIQRQQQEARQ
jgi:hypothetical protein